MFSVREKVRKFWGDGVTMPQLGNLEGNESYSFL